MKNPVRSILLLVVVGLAVVLGLAAIPAWAAELRMTGFVDTAFPHFQSNVSPPRDGGDSDVTLGNDQHTIGRTRGRMYFNVIASDDLRGVFGFELDAVWGACPDGAHVLRPQHRHGGEHRDQVDLRRFPRAAAARRQSLAPGRDAPLCHAAAWRERHARRRGRRGPAAEFHRSGGAHLYYVQFEENGAPGVDTFPGMPVANQFGEDYATGMTLRLKPLEGWDLHIPFVYGHLQIPSNSMTSQSGPAVNSPQYFTNVTTESRYYAGIDSRYRMWQSQH